MRSIYDFNGFFPSFMSFDCALVGSGRCLTWRGKFDKLMTVGFRSTKPQLKARTSQWWISVNLNFFHSERLARSTSDPTRQHAVRRSWVGQAAAASDSILWLLEHAVPNDWESLRQVQLYDPARIFDWILRATKRFAHPHAIRLQGNSERIQHENSARRLPADDPPRRDSIHGSRFLVYLALQRRRTQPGGDVLCFDCRRDDAKLPERLQRKRKLHRRTLSVQRWLRRWLLQRE